MKTRNLQRELNNGETFDELKSWYYCEALSTRSEQHEWKIPPHRHLQLHQVFLITDGGGDITLDEHQVHLSQSGLIVIPNGVVHSFNWISDSRGYVLSLANSAVSEIAQQTDTAGAITEPHVLPLERDRIEDYQGIFQRIQSEDQLNQMSKDKMVMALLQQLFILLYRLKPNVTSQQPNHSKPERKVRQFKALVTQFGTVHHKVSWYADQIGVTSAHLHQLTKHFLDVGALELIHSYLLDEAKRHLIYADLPIAHIADKLGFGDPTYFSKFFRKLTDVTPAAYRKTYR